MNVFISRPTQIEDTFEKSYQLFHDFLQSQGFVIRRLGQSDYSWQAPLLAVMDIINQCQGAIVLGYPHLQVRHEVKLSKRVQNSADFVFPTPWNQIEGVLAYRAQLPVLVVTHPGIEGGIFDHGTTGEGVLHVDLDQPDWFTQAKFGQPFAEWRSDVIKRFQGGGQHG